eukprot:scaffold1267_cov171-Amphora_coffeaeformis.AAC.29
MIRQNDEGQATGSPLFFYAPCVCYCLDTLGAAHDAQKHQAAHRKGGAERAGGSSARYRPLLLRREPRAGVGGLVARLPRVLQGYRPASYLPVADHQGAPGIQAVLELPRDQASEARRDICPARTGDRPLTDALLTGEHRGGALEGEVGVMSADAFVADRRDMGLPVAGLTCITPIDGEVSAFRAGRRLLNRITGENETYSPLPLQSPLSLPFD